MGACLAVDEAAARSRAIDKQNWRDFTSDRGVVKLLLLGTGRKETKGGRHSWCDEIYSGGSGKSTILKQMKLVHGECSSQAHRRAFIEICRSNVLTSMAAILEACQVQGSPLPPHLQESQLRVIKAAESGPGGNLYTSHLASDIKNLWADLTVRAMAERGSQFQVMPVSSLGNNYNNVSSPQLADSGPYFLSHATRLAEADYLPTDEDILRARAVTSGIVVFSFQV